VHRVVVTERIDEAGLHLLRARTDCIEMFAGTSPLQALLPEADALVVRIRPIGEAELDHAPRLRVIGKHGIGVDNIDLAAARARGIAVVFTPGSNGEAVAEHTLTVMLMLARRIESSIAHARAGRFQDGRDAAPGFDLQGRTLGLIGVGRIGGRVAQICRAALDMPVLAYDPYASDAHLAAIGAERCNVVDDVVRAADIVSIHTPLTSETRHIIDARRLDLMRPHAIVINCARGSLIDERALAEALRAGTIGGAAIDAFAQEPPPLDHPLLHLPNCIVTPHIAGGSQEAMRLAATMVAEDVLRVLAGEAPRWPVP